MLSIQHDFPDIAKTYSVGKSYQGRDINVIELTYEGAGEAPKGEKITEASMRLSGTETYIRVECVDEYGRTAWSNPYYL